MATISEEKISGRIIDYMSETFPRVDAATLSPGTDLIEEGIVDSFGLIEIVSFIQREFNITVNDDDILPENFITVEAMTNYILRTL